MEKQPVSRQGWFKVLLFVVVYLVITYLLVAVSGLILSALNQSEIKRASATDLQDLMKGRFLLTKLLISFAASFITVFAFIRLVDKRSFASLGFTWNGFQSHAAAGFFLGTLLLGIGSMILVAHNNLQWTEITFDGRQLFLSVGLMIFVAFSEELVFRGYILGNLMQSMNKWIALILSALLFTLFHRNNPSINPVALVNIFLAGLLLGVNFIYTRNLWFGIFLHFSWNFYQGSILGFKVSGLDLQSLLQQELTGSAFFTGGDFGFEASLVDSALSIVAVILLIWVYEKRAAGDHTLPVT